MISMSITLDKRTALHIHVGANIPGYLPESDVGCFDDLDTAIDHLRHALKDQQDYYYEQCWASEKHTDDPDGCDWHSVAMDVEAAQSAIVDSGPDKHFVDEGRAAWIFRTPEGPDMHHWALSITTDRETCLLNEDD